MAGISIERIGYVSTVDLVADIVKDLSDNGFQMVYPVSGVFNKATDTKAVLECTTTVDPLADTQPWRIYLEAIVEGAVALKARMAVGTPLQILNAATVTKLEAPAQGSQTPQEWAGIIGKEAFSSSGQTSNRAFNYFIDRTVRINSMDTAASFPMSYRITISPRGVVIFVWEQASDPTGDKFSWVAVQRPVDHNTGAVVATGKAPVFCVYSTGNKIRRFVVREADVLKPTVTDFSATENTEDCAAIINEEAQVAINEDGKYIVNFPNNLNTPRHAYTHELDMIAYTSADVVSAWSQVPLRVFGESSDRIYRAMNANGPNNTGMRILMLESGGGV